jgi:hypothetical protein
MEIDKADIVPANAYLPCIHKVPEVIGGLTFDTKMIRKWFSVQRINR